MTNMVELAEDMAVSPDGLMQSAGRIQFSGQVHPQVSASTAMAASETNYWILGKLPVAAVLEDAIITTDAKSVASTTFDIFKVPSAAAIATVGSGTILITQIDCAALTDATDHVCTVSSANKACAKGDRIVARVVTQGSETLEPVAYDLRFRV